MTGRNLAEPASSWGAAARAFIYTGSSAPHFLLPIWVALRLQVMALTLSDPMQAEHRAVALRSGTWRRPRNPGLGAGSTPHCASPCSPGKLHLGLQFLLSLCVSLQATFPLLLLTALDLPAHLSFPTAPRAPCKAQVCTSAVQVRLMWANQVRSLSVLTMISLQVLCQ